MNYYSSEFKNCLYIFCRKNGWRLNSELETFILDFCEEADICIDHEERIITKKITKCKTCESIKSLEDREKYLESLAAKYSAIEKNLKHFSKFLKKYYVRKPKRFI